MAGMDPFIHLWNTCTLTSIVQAAAVGEDAGDDVGDDGDEKKKKKKKKR